MSALTEERVRALLADIAQFKGGDEGDVVHSGWGLHFDELRELCEAWLVSREASEGGEGGEFVEGPRSEDGEVRYYLARGRGRIAEWPDGAGGCDRLYVVGDMTLRPDIVGDRDPESENVWTVSPRPDAQGWETDSGCPGYGLPLAVAELIALLYNEAGS